VVVDTDCDITIKEKEFRGSEGLWDLLTCKRLNKHHITSDDLRTDKKEILMTNAHLEGYKFGGVINFTGWPNVSRNHRLSFREAHSPVCGIGVTPRV